MDEGRHEFTDGVYGWITHTDLSSRDPAATAAWCDEVLGWSFGQPIEGSTGPYHVFTYSDTGGGGIRSVGDDEQPGSVPTVHVRNTERSVEAAVAAGAEIVQPPTRVMEGVCVARVRAPGGVVIGFSGPTG